jgi:ATP synthase protein I
MSPGTQQLVTDSEQTGDEESSFKALTAEEAAVWRRSHKQVSIWSVVAAQVAAALLVGVCAAWVTGVASVGWSALYGGMAVAVPSVVMAHGMTSSRLARLLSVVPAGSLGSVFFWEGVKVLLAVVMLVVAPAVVRELSWLALVAGLVVVLKVYWLAFLVLSRYPKQ